MIEGRRMSELEFRRALKGQGSFSRELSTKGAENSSLPTGIEFASRLPPRRRSSIEGAILHLVPQKGSGQE